MPPDGTNHLGQSALHWSQAANGRPDNSETMSKDAAAYRAHTQARS